MRIGEDKVSKVGVGAMTSETRVHRAINNRARIGITTKERGAIRQQGILASKPQRTTVLLSQFALSMGRITQGNADKGLPYVISAVRKGITLRGMQLRL